MKRIYGLAFVAALGLAATASAAQEAIRIGDINSYKCQPLHLGHYKRGLELAVDQINAAGGVNGRKITVITRDDNCNPGDAIKAAEELVAQEKVDLLTGSFLSSVALALNDFAKRKEVPLLTTLSLSDKQIWQNGNRYSFRLRSGTYTQTKMLVAEAAKLNKKRWALVYPNYEFGQLSAATFKTLLKEAQPDVEFVAEQAPPLGKVDAPYVVQALADAKPDAIFNVLFGADLMRFARAGTSRGLFDGRDVVSLVTGEPENLQALGVDTPNGWIVTGYPPNDVRTPEHEAFIKAYRARYKDDPGISAVMGYAAMETVAAAVRKAGSTEPQKVVAALRGLEVDTPFGRIAYRPEDNQSTIGAFVGRTVNEGGKGSMTGSRYLDGAAYQPTAADVKAWRAPD